MLNKKYFQILQKKNQAYCLKSTQYRRAHFDYWNNIQTDTFTLFQNEI